LVPKEFKPKGFKTAKWEIEQWVFLGQNAFSSSTPKMEQTYIAYQMG
jgi:hypothetical protein